MDLPEREIIFEQHDPIREIVRCKNCVHYVEFLSTEPEHKKFCDRLDWFSDENDFCSKGEPNKAKIVRCKECEFNNRCMLQNFIRDNAVEAIADEWFCANDESRSQWVNDSLTK